MEAALILAETKVLFLLGDLCFAEFFGSIFWWIMESDAVFKEDVVAKGAVSPRLFITVRREPSLKDGSWRWKALEQYCSTIALHCCWKRKFLLWQRLKGSINPKKRAGIKPVCEISSSLKQRGVHLSAIWDKDGLESLNTAFCNSF